MRWIVENRETAKKIGALAHVDVAERWCKEPVANKISMRLREIQRKHLSKNIS
jgi:hypothetical protein